MVDTNSELVEQSSSAKADDIRPKTALPLSILSNSRDRFMKLFYEPKCYEINKKTNLYLHVLRIDGGEFVIASLFKELKNISLSYVLSRRKMKEVLDDPSRMVEFVTDVRDKFKSPDPKAGEGGELLLYSFLESHLAAPKILSKMELKTSYEHYVHGSDGVHLLQVSQNEYQLIFGESKMYANGHAGVAGSVRHGIEAAFKSMSEIRKKHFDSDSWLVESELLKESVDSVDIDLLKQILLPPAASPEVFRKSNAFGVFIGYELDVTTYPFEDYTNAEIEDHLINLAYQQIENEMETIRSQIIRRGLGGYHFHMYALPFLKHNVDGKVVGIEDIRFDLASALSNKPVRR